MNCKRQIQLMGTSIDLNIYHANDRELLNKAEGLLHDYNIRFSANDATSELMKVPMLISQQHLIECA